MPLDFITRNLWVGYYKSKNRLDRYGETDWVVYAHLYLYVEVNLCSRYSSLLTGGYLKIKVSNFLAA
jgi:hypothetical protein